MTLSKEAELQRKVIQLCIADIEKSRLAALEDEDPNKSEEERRKSVQYFTELRDRLQERVDFGDGEYWEEEARKARELIERSERRKMESPPKIRGNCPACFGHGGSRGGSGPRYGGFVICPRCGGRGWI